MKKRWKSVSSQTASPRFVGPPLSSSNGAGWCGQSHVSESGPEVVFLACHAMRTRFELFLWGDDPHRLRAAGEEAVLEIETLDRQLSFFAPQSDVARLNREAAQRSVVVEPQLFQLLQKCARFWQATAGAFDPTVPPVGEKSIRTAMGWSSVVLDAAENSVRYSSPDTALNLGAVGKGYAVDRAIELLKDDGVVHAFLHGGTSSVRTLGHAPDGQSWKVAIPLPREDATLATIALDGTSLGVSGFQSQPKDSTDEGKPGSNEIPHIIDPRTGAKATACQLAAVVCESAAASDALSTSLFCSGLESMSNASLLDDESLMLAAIELRQTEERRTGHEYQECRFWENAVSTVAGFQLMESPHLSVERVF